MATQELGPTPKKSIPPILWIVAVAVVIFSATGTAAIMGWLPTSFGSTNENVAVTTKDTRKDTPGSAATVPTAKTVCSECGTIESIREIKLRGAGSGLGAVGGAVVGGLVGNQIGGGDGKKVATAAGVIGGAVAGHQIEKEVTATRSYETTVRLNDGSTRLISSATMPSWQNGDKVKVVNGGIQLN